MAFNLRELPRTVVSSDMAGKSVLIYGASRTGKTSQACKFPKPLVLAFENGLRSIPGIAYAPMTKWSDFVSILKELSNPSNQDYVRENFETIVLDELSVACEMCSEYVCQTNGAESISKGNNGYGLWQELDSAFSKQIRILMNLPLTIIIIAHEGTRDFQNDKGETISKIYPAGAKRLVPMAVQLCDIIAYLEPQGLDENGNEIPSSAIMVQTKDVYAGSRFSHLAPGLKEFSAKNLTEAIREAVKLEEESSGVKSVSYEEQKARSTKREMTFDELRNEIGTIVSKLMDAGRGDEYTNIINTYFGRKDFKIQAIKKDEEAETRQAVECVLAELKNLNI